MAKHTQSAEKSITEIIENSQILEIGMSKYEAKQSFYKQGISDPHVIASNTGISSYSSLKTYKNVWIDCCKFARANYPGEFKQLQNINPKVVGEYIQSKIDDDCSLKYVNKCCSALNKFDNCLQRMDIKVDFSDIISEKRALAKDILTEASETTRAFKNPTEVIANMQNPTHQVVAELQLNYGLRIGDCKYINIEKQLDGNVLTVNHSKNGQPITKVLSPDIANQLRSMNGLNVKYETYLYDLKKACNATGENYTGSHAFRHNFAQDKMEHYISNGCSEKTAVKEISEEMGHHRPDITYIYLR